MKDPRIILTGIWIALMLTYLLGDVLRIFAGHFEPGKIDGVEATKWMWLGMAAIMLVPIVMILLTLIIPFPAVRIVCIVVALLLFVFNIFGLPYKGAYDNFLIVVGLLFNLLTVWIALKWTVE